MRKPTPLPRLRCPEQAAWTAGYWTGKVIGAVVGFGLAVLCGVIK